jgi:hypothetical protein
MSFACDTVLFPYDNSLMRWQAFWLDPAPAPAPYARVFA